MTSSLSIIHHILLTGCLIAVSSGQSARISYSFTEENRESLTLGNVAEDSGILAENTDIQVDDARYIFFGEASPHRDLFEIDATTGDLRVRESVDRDLPSVCEGRELCEVSLDISARFGSQNFILGVDVTILDINDNEPIFDERMTSGTLSEDANIGDLLTLETANDRDSPHYGIRTYQLQQTQPETFSLLVTNTSGGHYVQLVLQSELDREVQDAYALQLFAVDGGSPALTGTLQVQVIVGDENDNRPVFQNSTYEVYVAENILPDATVITVQADDADSRQNARIVYGFNDRTEQAYGSMFQIDPHSGLVSTSSALDFALGPTIELGLTASDSDTNLPSTATLFVNIVDLNDNPPSITVNSPTMDGHFTVQEHREIGIFVGHITVIDRDGGDNGRFTCSLSSAFFNLRPYPGLSSEFEIATLTSLDRESIPQHQLTMRCSDQGSPPLTSTEIINIDVTDVNDHTPTFTRQRYIVELAENSPPGTYLTTVSATDDDSGQNSLLTYSMLGSAADLFEINAATGEITTKSRLDYEIEPRIELGVKVDDSGEIPKSDTAVVAISVLDIDDEPPQFHQPSYTFSIFENNAPGYELGNLTASDPDTPGSGSTQTFVYSLDPSTNPDGLFHIDSLTGTLSVNRPLDAESRAQYHVYARAVSRVTVPPQSSHVQVLIIVRDINDNPPYIQYPSPGNNTIHIDGDQSTGSVVTQIRALDVDQSTSGSENLLYVISAGNQKGLFAVEERTGIIHTSTSMSPYVGERYSLLLTVYDQGVPPRRTNTTLTVLIDSPGSGAVKPGQSGGSNGIVTDRNLVIVIAIACVTGVIVVILLVGIVAVLRRRHHVNNGGKYNYKARMVDQRVLVGGGSINSTNGSGSRRGSVDHKNVDTGVHSTHEGEDAVSDLWAHEKQQQPYGNHGQPNDSFLTQNSDRATPVHGNHRTQHPHNHRQMQPLDLPLHDLGLKDAGSDIEQVSNTDSGRGSNEDVGTHSPRGSNQPGTSHKAPATHRNRPSTSSWREGEFRHPIATNDLHPGMYPGGPEDYPPPTLHPRASRTPSIQSQNSQQMQANQMPRNELPVRSQSDRTKSLYKGQRNTNQDRHYKPSTNQNRPYWDHVTLQEQDEMMPSHV